MVSIFTQFSYLFAHFKDGISFPGEKARILSRLILILVIYVRAYRATRLRRLRFNVEHVPAALQVGSFHIIIPHSHST